MAHWSRLRDMSPEWDYCRQTFFRGDTWMLMTWRAADGRRASSTLVDLRLPPCPDDGSDTTGRWKLPGLLWHHSYRRDRPLTPGGLEEAHWHLVAQIVAGRLPPG